ncbi:MAG: NADH-quinone oxidoreductase subunit F [Halobacteriota archaeon]
MTTRPELAKDIDLFPGLLAAALFGFLAVVVLGASFAGAAGFETDAPITASIGYALIDLEGVAATVASEGFLAALVTIAFLLDAALGGAVMLARRDGGEH